MTYARHYFARYPGLSLGHHPLLTPLLEVPFLAAFGPSVWAGRLSVLCTIGVMLLVWFRLIEQRYDTTTAFFASALLGTAPAVVAISKQVESEPVALCSVVVAFFFLQRYCRSAQARDGLAFIAAAILSVYAKQITVVMFPVYLAQFALTFGVRGLFSRRAITAVAIIGVGALPVVALSLRYSHFNVQIVTQFISVESRFATNHFVYLARVVTDQQVGILALAAALVSATLAVARRDGTAGLFIVWVASVYVGLFALGVGDTRYACYGVLALCALAANLLQAGKTPRQRQVLAGVLVFVVCQQVFASARIQVRGATGYEEAARFVSEQRLGDSVLYCATEDTGFFVFFVRKHDPQRDMIVLRADKLLTTSRMFRSEFERVIHQPDEIAPILKQFGVGYVVIEDRQTPDGPLEWLRQMVHGDRFALRRRIPVVSSDPRLRDLALGVYEYRDRTPADPDARLSMKIPLMDDTIAVTFRDLQHHEP